jgi:nicotinamidase-related amidase
MRALLENPAGYVTDKYDTFAVDWYAGSVGAELQGDIYLVGTCTDICVISNALVLKTVYPKKNITVYENLCAGTTLERHKAAIEVMKSCQIDIATYKSSGSSNE